MSTDSKRQNVPLTIVEIIRLLADKSFDVICVPTSVSAPTGADTPSGARDGAQRPLPRVLGSE